MTLFSICESGTLELELYVFKLALHPGETKGRFNCLGVSTAPDEAIFFFFFFFLNKKARIAEKLTSRVDLLVLPVCDDLAEAVEPRGWNPGGEGGLFGGFDTGPWSSAALRLCEKPRCDDCWACIVAALCKRVDSYSDVKDSRALWRANSSDRRS